MMFPCRKEGKQPFKNTILIFPIIRNSTYIQNKNMVVWKIQVIGKVQGVYFRANTKKTAQKLGLKGRVRNETDGSVRIEVQGEPDRVDRFLEWVHKGPPRARVDQVFIRQESVQEQFDDFEIIR